MASYWLVAVVTTLLFNMLDFTGIASYTAADHDVVDFNDDDDDDDGVTLKVNSFTLFTHFKLSV